MSGSGGCSKARPSPLSKTDRYMVLALDFVSMRKAVCCVHVQSKFVFSQAASPH